MCSDMSPMRSSDALTRSAVTTMRRSRATGCWRARISIACSSRATASSSILASSAMTSSASATSLVANERVAFSMDTATRSAISTSRVLQVLEGLVEDFAHGCAPFVLAAPRGTHGDPLAEHGTMLAHRSGHARGDCLRRRLTVGALLVNSSAPWASAGPEPERIRG